MTGNIFLAGLSSLGITPDRKALIRDQYHEGISEGVHDHILF